MRRSFARLIKALQGAETCIIDGSTKARNNLAETIKWWQWLTTPEHNAFMVNENQERIPSCVDAPMGPVWQEIAQFKLPVYDYGIAWWGEGLYWDVESFNTMRSIFVAWITGQIDRETHFARQQTEWEEASARYEKVMEEQANQ